MPGNPRLKTKSNLSIQEYGAGILLKNLSALEGEFEGVRKGEDIEAIHRMRVASRRLRAALPLFGPAISAKKHLIWIKHISRLTKALGAARDSDVQIDHLNEYYQGLPPGPARPGARRLLLRLRQQRQKLQSAVNDALDDVIQSSILMEMERKLRPIIEDLQGIPQTPELCSLASNAIREKLQLFLEYEPYIDQPEAKEELHAMRIAAKRLRYTLEIFSPLYDSELKSYLKVMRQVQELLGDIHDCDVWMVFLPEFQERERIRTLRYFGHQRPFQRLVPGLEAYLANRSAMRDQSYAEFLKKWQIWRQEGLWDRLINEVTAKCVQTQSIPPDLSLDVVPSPDMDASE